MTVNASRESQQAAVHKHATLLLCPFTNGVPFRDTKRNYLIALAITAACGLVFFGEPALAQLTIFSDTFGSGSTLNQPPATPTAISASYEYGVGFTDNFVSGSSSISPADLSLTLPDTSSILGEIQAQFTSAPVTLVNPGDYINLMVTFVDTAGVLSDAATANSTVNIGLYNSGGSAPQQGLTVFESTTSPTNGAQNWQGYVGRIILSGAPEFFTRPAQTNATSTQNQDLLFNNASSTQAFNSPKGVIFGVGATGMSTLTDLSTYTMNFRITLNGASSITVSNALFSGAGTNGTQLFGFGATTNGVPTSSFDGLAFGWRYSGGIGASTMDINSITVTYGTPLIGPNSWINAAGGKWELGTNWSSGMAPSLADSVDYITNNTSETVTIDVLDRAQQRHQQMPGHQ